LEENFHFSQIYGGFGLEIFKILSGKLIPETHRVNLREGEKEGGFYCMVLTNYSMEIVYICRI